MLGRLDLSPVSVFYATRGAYFFLLAMVGSANLVYQVDVAKLSTLELVLVGALMEATIFICEVPTGVVADTVSRRLSVVIGFFLFGIGWMIVGASPQFATIMAAQLVIGVGSTFISGAHQAWIADEIGVERVGTVYLKSAQIAQVCRLVGTPLSIAFAAVFDVWVPIVIAGASYALLAPIMLAAMSEKGFKPPERGIETQALESMKRTLVEGSRLVKGSELLVIILAISLIYGMASEGFDRLFTAHFFRNLGFPEMWHLEPIIWIGVVRTGWVVLGIIVISVVIKKVNTASEGALTRSLFVINALQAVSLVGFALAGNFEVGMLMCWSGVALSVAHEPLYLAWINQHVESQVRATVISMGSQLDSLGQIIGGPALGTLGTLTSLRAALLGAGAVLLPALLLYTRAAKLGSTPKS
ncbi:MAG TPA: MFS transporter, partial [Dehalococcoidia bacterium]|nr:MFS transporter [Dehalococcoidia bacterium]